MLGIPLVFSYNTDDGGKYSASEERTFSKTSVGCCAGIASVCQYPGPCESVDIKLLVSPVSFLHNNLRLYSWFIFLTQSLLIVRLAVSEIKRVQTDKQTDGQTDRQTELSTIVTLAAHAREG